MPQLNLIGNTSFTLGSRPELGPFIAIGGIKETFVTGGISYTLHSFISGSGSFQILQGSADIEVLVVGGGGAGSQGIQRSPITDDEAYERGNGGGAGGYVFVSQYVKKSPQYEPSVFDAYVGEGGRFVSGGFTLNATQSSFIQTYDQRGYYFNPPIITSSFPGGDGGFGPNGASGGGGGGQAIYGTQGNNGGVQDALAGGGGAGRVGGDRGISTAGVAGDGITLPVYFGGASGSYPIRINGGGDAGGYFRIGEPPLGTFGKAIASSSGSYGGGAGGSNAAGFAQPTLTQLTGSNGLVNTGGGGGGGGTLIDYPANTLYYGPAGNGGSGVIRVAYQTQF
jgi:hypothetical protein